jgi:glycosyltransferase involved in cell wall biosynthesis
MTIQTDSNSTSPAALVEPIYREIPGEHASAPPEGALELSIVMPCLNEADTVGTCVEKAMRILREHQIAGEVIVADNGSADGSQEIATRLGARVVQVAAKGYGNALMGGIAAARGRFVLMGDADDSYDFLETPKFLARLREGYDMVQGCRLPRGGGVVRPGAMPFLHRWWGNPMFSIMAATMFRAPIHDIYCGMRGFTKSLYDRLALRCTGMEFATEMIIKSSIYRENITEVPITLHPDGRKAHAPHLKTFRDGWRTMRFYLMYSPRWLFLLPGLALMLLGTLGYCLALPAVRIGGITFDAHTLLVSTLLLLMGAQAVWFAVAAKVFAVSEGLLPAGARFERFFSVATLERGLILGASSFTIGAGLLVWAVVRWGQARWGHLDYASTMRIVIPGFTLAALGFQTILSSFFVSILGMKRK